MCDTLVLCRDGETWLAKNSDRDPLEAQRVEVVPAVRGDTAKKLRCTWIEIPQVPDRHACVIGRPAWMWGAEMGVNECGVSIGNEAIFSRRVMRHGAALLGMDLLRLALERSDTAEAALQTIVELLEQFGQGGPAGYTQKDFRYDNSFLIADAGGAWKLETAGRYWVAQRVDRLDSISNALTIDGGYQRACHAFHGDKASARTPSFRRRFDTRLFSLIGASHRRRHTSLAALRELVQRRPGFADFAAILRHHRRGRPSGNADLCMHAAQSRSPLRFLRPSQTVNAMIVRLDESGPRVSFTGTSSSCISLFRPVGFSGHWQVCESDLWERHKIWGEQFGLRHSHPEMTARLVTAEQAIFAYLQRGELTAAESAAREAALRLFHTEFMEQQTSLQESV